MPRGSAPRSAASAGRPASRISAAERARLRQRHGPDQQPAAPRRPQRRPGRVPPGADGGEPEVSDNIFAQVLFYSRNLAVPARRKVDDPQVLAGKRLFAQANCVACHVPAFTTGSDASEPELANQRIRPYSDLLLHDMGDGLADNRPEFRQRAGLANPAAMGHRPDRNGQRPHPVPPRRARPQSAGGDLSGTAAKPKRPSGTCSASTPTSAAPCWPS